MLGLLLLYYVGKAFYNLAIANNKNGWLFGILGVVVYYGGIFIGQVLIILVYTLWLKEDVEGLNNMLIALMSIPVGILTCWGFYALLKRSWTKPQRVFEENILDDDFK